mmetsp:Transcript_30294/g.54861  ORF Transcript_30294/g.54861 Transcript_30294/m.54861 type:complete len:287 (+) Transcript_30294:78-938(+)|eukprot:CAMPEP_0201868660 /NCGR_PEP_ID=MMETSP0902-20130614/2451_1 /ASSEMBLY_ACC=CAM_ASM_000551 /TAXON_ID=420261 /ORGANISM="Thalassiosira antarctica, Strain CCMP982" /LENGTH=286 /DNA_ID=CAMNT_0048394023 /DNA_START=31 /DNA_END=891 /DNA_ORIENTATION=+
MNSLITTTILLLGANGAQAFAPPSSSTSPLHHQARSAKQALSFSPQDISFLISDASDAIADVATTAVDAVTSSAAVTVPSDFDPSSSTEFAPSYSNASYYTTLGLYALSFPGLWSQVKRSTKAKVKRKTYVSDGEATKGGVELRQQAGEIMAYMKANNYEVAEAGETITFRGLVARSVSQACFLVFCTVIGMSSLALVLQTQFHDLVLPVIGEPNWFYLVLLSPYAGIYYWQSGDRVDDLMVKLATNDDETLNEISVEGNDEEIERMWRTLELREKGMVKVEGILE